MIERRQARRLKSFLRGTVDFDTKRGMMSCLVRDLSAQGARIIFSETVAIPDVVNLHIPQREQTWRAQVQWRRGDEIGLSFVTAGSAQAQQESGVSERMAQLEGELGVLKRKLKRLKRDNRRDEDAGAA